MKVSEESVLEELRKVLGKRGKKYEESPVAEEDKTMEKEKTRKEILEEEILCLLLKLPDELESFDKNYLFLLSPKTKEVLTFLKKKKSKVPPKMKEFLDVLALRSEIEEELEQISKNPI